MFTELKIDINRKQGNGKCTVYFIKGDFPPDECDCFDYQDRTVVSDEFQNWIKENYEQRFVIEDDETHTVFLNTDEQR